MPSKNMISNSTTAATQPRKIKNKIPIALTDTSAILGLLMLIMSFAYLFIAVSVTKENSKLEIRCACTLKGDFRAMYRCRSKGATDSFQTSGINADVVNINPENDDLRKRFCRNIFEEIVAGGLGIFFGLFQTVVACVFLLAGVPNALKPMWMKVHAVIALVCVVIVLLVFDVILYKIRNRNTLDSTSIYFHDGFYHDGHPSNIRRANVVVFVYLAFVFLDVVATVGGILLMALQKPAGPVVANNE